MSDFIAGSKSQQQSELSTSREQEKPQASPLAELSVKAEFEANAKGMEVVSDLAGDMATSCAESAQSVSAVVTAAALVPSLQVSSEMQKSSLEMEENRGLKRKLEEDSCKVTISM